MRVNPKTERELQEEEAERMKALQCPDGTWDFEVIEAKDGFSKTSGAEMITVTLSVFAESDKPYMIKDYLLEAMAVKVRHFFASSGKIDLYNSGNFSAADCVGLCGKVIIKLGKAIGDYKAKPEVKDYVVLKDGDEAVKTQRQAVKETWDDDDESSEIPF